MKDNNLSNETSLYLLQHAENPVHWQPWSEAALDYAKEEDKLLIVSIGYSSCHWCHVMEKESFEDLEVATFMNKHFVNVKVDREERPDVDKLYMSAIQLMGVQGGWPLNCILLPDGRPIYGGTYFKKEKWLEVLKALVETSQKQPDRVEAFAKEIQGHLQDASYEQIKDADDLNFETIQEWVSKLKSTLDTEFGGYKFVPKFPLPNHLVFLLDYGSQEQDEMIELHLRRTLFAMGNGGIYDHVEGGFSRYSTDALWKVPHFEKMLYDNAQLIELYSKAAMHTNSNSDFEFYGTIVNETFEYLKRNLKTNSGPYLCSQDADSDGAEGLYYCWRKDEIQQILKTDFHWVKILFGIHEDEVWENGLFILQRKQALIDIAEKQSWTIAETKEHISRIKNILLSNRAKRTRPVIDTKSLTSWNALLINGLTKAFLAFNNEEYLKEAKGIAAWIIEKQLDEKGALKRNYVEGVSSIDGFLDDYAITIQSFICLYQIQGDLSYLLYAKRMTSYVFSEFYSETQKLFFYTQKDAKLIARKIDVDDDVIPSSNSVMAHNLYELGVYFRKDDWLEKSQEMLGKVKDLISKYPSGYLNWMALYFRILKGTKELHVLTENKPNCAELSSLLRKRIIISYHKEIPMTEGYSGKGIFFCENNTCLPRIESIEALLKQI